ncbi:PaaI family thioesterase [Dinoroseobacter sp. PD6]|uniref:PaaI family thioesterase n=1 Tax=Dinoroseobacter sp. PD6 TaxID=3028384 RepID=UPI00237C30B4|nr:PaaI family thioesterase [Dinoroseobacter sp. PD6]MDD9716658.1 PaaI family thioesterase [Dinoroseobacter sp. PD6]
MSEPFIPSTLDDLKAVTGLAFMQAVLSGKLPSPPMAETLGYRLTEVAPGRVVFTGTPDPAHCNPMGGVHGGWYGTLLDSAMGCAVMTTVPKGRLYTTLEYKINITRALPPGTRIAAEGVVDHGGRTTAVAHGEIRGLADGKPYATGTTTCLILNG